MSTKKYEIEKSGLDKAIDSVLREMESLTADSPEFERMVNQLDKLYKMKQSVAPARISPEVVLTVAGNLAGIGMILGYEKANVITSKALNFIIKPRA